jgi:PGF-CTERM protein
MGWSSVPWGRITAGALFAVILLTVALGSVPTAEAATTVSQCQEINSSNAPADGQVVLGNDVSAAGTCFTVTTGDVILDGQGNTITGPGDGADNGSAVYINSSAGSNVTVRDVTIREFTDGVERESGVSDVTVERVTVRQLGGAGVRFVGGGGGGIVRDTTVEQAGGISLGSGGARVENVTVNGSDGGISGAGTGVTVVDAEINGAAFGINLGGTGTLVRSSTVQGAGTTAITFNGADDALVVDTVVETSEQGVSVEGGTNVTARNVTVRGPNAQGIRSAQATTDLAVEDSTVTDAGGRGIEIDGVSGVSVARTTVTGANAAGIYVDGSSSVVLEDNHVLRNNDGFAGLGGVEVRQTDDATFRANLVQDNRQNGVLIRDANGTLVADNQIVDNCGGQVGLQMFNVNDTLVVGNNVSENTGVGVQAGNGTTVPGRNLTIRDTTILRNQRGATNVYRMDDVTYEGVMVRDNADLFDTAVTGADVVRDSVVVDNAGNGIKLQPGATVENVTVRNNGDEPDEFDLVARSSTSVTDLTVGDTTIASGQISNVTLNTTGSVPAASGADEVVLDAPVDIADQDGGTSPYADVTVTYTDSEASSVDESTLGLARYDGSSWQTVAGSTNEPGANSVSANATTFSTFAPLGQEPTTSSGGGDSGGPSGDITVTGADLSTAAIQPGESVTVTATVENTQGSSAAKTLRLRVGNREVGQQTVYVSGETTQTFSLTYSPSRAGEYDLTVNSVDAGTLMVSDSAGDDGTDEATVTDTATDGDGGATEPETATPPPTTEPADTVGASTTTAAVTDSPTAEGGGGSGSPTPTPTTGGGPGFGAVAAVVALLTATFLAVRRR